MGAYQVPRAWINAVYAVVTTTDLVDASGDVIVLYRNQHEWMYLHM